MNSPQRHNNNSTLYLVGWGHTNKTACYKVRLQTYKPLEFFARLYMYIGKKVAEAIKSNRYACVGLEKPKNAPASDR